MYNIGIHFLAERLSALMGRGGLLKGTEELLGKTSLARHIPYRWNISYVTTSVGGLFIGFINRSLFLKSHVAGEENIHRSL